MSFGINLQLNNNYKASLIFINTLLKEKSHDDCSGSRNAYFKNLKFDNFYLHQCPYKNSNFPQCSNRLKGTFSSQDISTVNFTAHFALKFSIIQSFFPASIFNFTQTYFLLSMYFHLEIIPTLVSRM
jgi:hypothetical protein